MEEGDGEVDERTNDIQSFVIVYNVAKRHNLGTLARSATAFGVSELILVGKKDFNAFGSHGSTLHLQFRHFFTLSDARLYLKQKGCDIFGVEIVDGATPIHQQTFTGSAAFLLGNEGLGLSDKEMSICDSFVYIPQYGCGTASLNVTVAASIVLHHFAVWAGFLERQRDGNKFVVAERPSKQMPRRSFSESPDTIAKMRRVRRVAIGDWLDQDPNDCEALDSREISLTVSSEPSTALSKLFE